jgi:ring-1,2-phenylacetyl-CoA epoxidase subunit PaaE
VTGIIRETEDAISIKLVPELYPPAPGTTAEQAVVAIPALSYKAGQFLTLVFNKGEREIRRSYSLSSSPDVDTELCITVKRIINGEISRYLFEKLKPGDRLEALPPNGRFIVIPPDPPQPRDLLLITAGSGITPVYSIIKSALIREPLCRLTLIYSNRNAKSAIFYEELVQLQASSSGKLKCIFIFSDRAPRPDSIRGHLNKDMLQMLISENLHYQKQLAEFYLCGPFTFMRMAEIALIAMGFDENRLHRENFVINAEQEAINTPPYIEDITDKKVFISFPGGTAELIVPARTNILEAALRNGVSLPYSCRAGICGSCAARCSKGEVLMSNNQVLTKKDLDQGWILTCTGYPATKTVELNFG